MASMRRRPKIYGSGVRDTVRERIAFLIEEAQAHIHEQPERAARMIYLARKYSTRYKVRFTSAQRRRICRKCATLLVPGTNCRVRTRDGKLIYFCMACKSHDRIPFRRDQKKRRRERLKSPSS